MDGVKESTTSGAKAIVPGLGTDLERTIEILRSVSFLTISDQTKLAAFSIRAKDFSGRLRIFVFRNYVIAALQSEHLGPRRVEHLLKNLSPLGWQATPKSRVGQSLFRTLDTRSTTVLASQVLNLLTELDLPSSALQMAA